MKRILGLGLIALLGLSLAACGSSDSGSEPKENNTPTEKKEEKKNTTHNVGDTVAVGDVEYTLTSVELTDERNEFDETNPAAVAKVTYTMKNNSEDELPVGMDVEVYGADDKKAESYPNDNTMGSVAPGKQMDCTAHFGINQTGEIEVHFAPAISLEKAAVFKATV